MIKLNYMYVYYQHANNEHFNMHIGQYWSNNLNIQIKEELPAILIHVFHDGLGQRGCKWYVSWPIIVITRTFVWWAQNQFHQQYLSNMHQPGMTDKSRHMQYIYNMKRKVTFICCEK